MTDRDRTRLLSWLDQIQLEARIADNDEIQRLARQAHEVVETSRPLKTGGR